MKIVKTRKDHKCWACGRTIKKGNMARAYTMYPNEARSLGMIDVCAPLYLIMHETVPDCTIVKRGEK